MDAEQIVHDVAEKVRALVSEAEQRAAEIVEEAEGEARRIRERAEAESRGRLEEVRRGLDDLQEKLTGAAGTAPSAEVEPGPVVVPEPQPPATPEPGPVPVPEPAPDPVPEPAPEPVPEPTPPPDEGTPPAAKSNGAEALEKSDDSAGARLVAMNMALDGATRAQIEARLAEDYEIDDRDQIVASVLALASK